MQIHNAYQHSGGEDTVVENEKLLLESYGNDVTTLLVSNDTIKSTWKKMQAGFNVVYSKSSKDMVKCELDKFEPDIVHVHNFFPLLTPSIYDACYDAGIPVVQTLHNYRTICPGALLMREGAVCEECLDGSPYRSVIHGCYRDSRLATLAVARLVDYHKKAGTWLTKVDRFIALTSFAKEKFIQAGFPAEKIVIKPNFYPGEVPSDNSEERNGFLFVGRLSEEKGVRTLLNAWKDISAPLTVAGEGPLLKLVKGANHPRISVLGQRSFEDVADEMKKALMLILPSECYETFGSVIVEAFANKLPVIVSKMGAMEELVEDGVTGLHFRPKDPEDLLLKVQWAMINPEKVGAMGERAFKLFKEKYTREVNYSELMGIYKTVILSLKNTGASQI